MALADIFESLLTNTVEEISSEGQGTICQSPSGGIVEE